MAKRILFVLLFSFYAGVSQSFPIASLVHVESFKEGEWFQLRLHYGPFNASYASFTLERDTLEQNPSFTLKDLVKLLVLPGGFLKLKIITKAILMKKLVLPISLFET
jgi:hypothetical protein